MNSVFTNSVCKSVRQLLTLALLLLAGLPSAALAQDQLNLIVRDMDGYGRMILTFPGRLDLPEYELRSENGVLSIEFANPFAVELPDIALILPDFVSVSRIDPDSRGIRFGLKAELRINRIEAGEQLYVDFLPSDWVGMPPSLPQSVVTRLSERARDAARLAEQRHKASLAQQSNPTATLSVGQNPTFVRLEFDWNVDTVADYTHAGDTALIEFGWPVELDLYPLDSNLPPEITRATSTATPDGNTVQLNLAEGVEPRFYKISDRRYLVDIDRLEPDLETLSAEELLAAAIEQDEAIRALEAANASAAESLEGPSSLASTSQTELTPMVREVGSSIRIIFPFDVETPAAVFRRGDVVWMVFDSPANINSPSGSEVLEKISDDFTVISAGDTQIVRMQLNAERLASIGSQGMGWALSIGDVLMASTEPIQLNRRQTRDGLFEIAADLGRPARVHEVRDPVVGDVLEVVTLFPPARGMVRELNFVDFDALRSVHGLVVRPINETLEVALTRREAMITSAEGLTVSSFVESRSVDSGEDALRRRGFVNLTSLEEPDPVLLNRQLDELAHNAAVSEGRERESLRLELARTLLANQLAVESIGVLQAIIEQNGAVDLLRGAQVSMAAATVVAGRSAEAIGMLNAPMLADAVDALMWRAIARTEARDYTGARVDVLASESVVDSYPDWVRNKFYLAGSKAAVETDDLELANRLMDRVVYSDLTRTEASTFELLQGRVAELAERYDEALDTYGTVIVADIRPTRVEAVFRTVALLDKMGRLDATKAAETLAVQAMVWRGGVLESQIVNLLARLQFRSGDYRGAFATLRNAAEANIQSDEISELGRIAEEEFADLYLNGEADGLEPIDALTLYYDYRQLTPAGARGDEMIRNLARRLIRVDLLGQAAELLEYQIDARLSGAARAQVAADLAIVYIANRMPEEALGVLNRTALANLTPSLDRQRRILEARALIDVSRAQLALDVLRTLEGRDADVLRIDALWSEGSFREAAEEIEIMYSGRNAGSSLPPAARLNLVKAGAGFVLANDGIGLSRLRARFAEELSNSPEWPMFDFVTSSVTQNSEGFRALAGEIAHRDSLTGFLGSYRETYGVDGALTPLATPSSAI